ncbi:MAG: HAD-IIA family hydrolase [Actinomycetota bacterium]|nr:HAD-IIA family hydrolase [Actinomycetota bacterium]
MAIDIDDIDGLVCDLDGVVYRGDEAIPGAVEALRELERRGRRVVLCTNNSAPTVENYREKLRAMGLEVAPERLVTSAVVAGEALSERGLAGPAFVVGAEGLREAVEGAGLDITGDPERAEVVVVGRDLRFDFDALRRAADAVRAGAVFIATNDDATYPSTAGLEPGAGALLAAIEVAGGRNAEVLGKPRRPMMERAAARFEPGARLAMVGDRAETDLAGAAAMGWTTVLVLSGVTGPGDVEALRPRPDFVLESLAELLHDGAR